MAATISCARKSRVMWTIRFKCDQNKTVHNRAGLKLLHSLLRRGNPMVFTYCPLKNFCSYLPTFLIPQIDVCTVCLMSTIMNGTIGRRITALKPSTKIAAPVLHTLANSPATKHVIRTRDHPRDYTVRASPTPKTTPATNRKIVIDTVYVELKTARRTCSTSYNCQSACVDTCSAPRCRSKWRGANKANYKRNGRQECT